MKRSSLLLLASTLFSISAYWLPASAAPSVYRCNGRVQNRPCSQAYPEYHRNVYTPPDATRRNETEAPSKEAPVAAPADVSAITFEKLSAKEGIWRGRVGGSGLVTLWLHLNDGEGHLEKRYIGSIELAGNSTTFVYRSPLPRAKGWDWSISATQQPVANS